MEDRPGRDRDAEHLLQAQSLGTELRLVVVPAPPLAALVFDGVRLRPELDQVGHPDKPEPGTAKPQTADRPVRALLGRPGRIGVNHTVGVAPLDRVAVLHPQTLAAVQGTAARADQKIIEGPDGLELIFTGVNDGHGPSSAQLGSETVRHAMKAASCASASGKTPTMSSRETNRREGSNRAAPGSTQSHGRRSRASR